MDPVINLHHPRQDINRARDYDSSRRRYRFAESLLPASEGDKILADIGGGAGEFVAIARDHGFRTILVDGNATSVKRERERGFEAHQADLIKGIPMIPDASVDVVVALEVIEHIVPAEQLLQEFRRIAKPEADVIISTPNFGFMKDRLRYLRGDDVKEEGYHYRFYTKRKLQGMICDAGMEVDRRASMGSALGLNLFLRYATFGKLKINQFVCPAIYESWLASTFVWRARPRRELSKA